MAFSMKPESIVNEVIRNLRKALPEGTNALRDDLEKNLQISLQAALKRLNLVSRDELEIQKAVLARTREKLDALEKLVAELEEKIKDQG